MLDYKIQLQVFEGPLDLLLYLIKKDEVDIYEVDLAKIATQFIEYIETMQQLDLEIAGEFLVMAATLLYIKSKELLPADQQALDSLDNNEEIDPRWELIRQLIEYKRFKEMASTFQQLEKRQDSIYPRKPVQLELPLPTQSIKPKLTLLDLLNAVSNVLKRYNEKNNISVILEERWTVSEKIQWLLNTIPNGKVMKFSELFSNASSKLEVIVTFLALLELVRLKQLIVSQPDQFAEIEITRQTQNNTDTNNTQTESQITTNSHSTNQTDS
jgi:segregation and condensation protein A